MAVEISNIAFMVYSVMVETYTQHCVLSGFDSNYFVVFFQGIWHSFFQEG